jgi:hypothetical protein
VNSEEYEQGLDEEPDEESEESELDENETDHESAPEAKEYNGPDDGLSELSPEQQEQLTDKSPALKQCQEHGQRKLIAALEAQAQAQQGLETPAPDDFAF